MQITMVVVEEGGLAAAEKMKMNVQVKKEGEAKRGNCIKNVVKCLNIAPFAASIYAVEINGSQRLWGRREHGNNRNAQNIPLYTGESIWFLFA